MNTVRVRILKDMPGGGVRGLAAGDIVETTITTGLVTPDGYSHPWGIVDGEFDVIDERAEAESEWGAIVDAMANGEIGVDIIRGGGASASYRAVVLGQAVGAGIYPTPSAAAQAAWKVLCEQRKESQHGGSRSSSDGPREDDPVR